MIVTNKIFIVEFPPYIKNTSINRKDLPLLSTKYI